MRRTWSAAAHQAMFLALRITHSMASKASKQARMGIRFHSVVNATRSSSRTGAFSAAIAAFSSCGWQHLPPLVSARVRSNSAFAGLGLDSGV